MLPRYKDIVELLKKGSTLEAQEQIMSLREGALELQEENQELRQRVKELEDVIRFNKDWGAEKQRYELVNPWRGPAQVYALKSTNADGEAPHFLCPHCFEQKRKVILTPHTKDGSVCLVCPSCKASLQTGFRRIGVAEYAEKYSEENG